MAKIISQATPGGPTFVDKFVEGKATISPRRLAGNVTGMFIAGSDTTSATIQWMLKHLAEDSELQHDARFEATAMLQANHPTFDAILNAVPLLRSLFWEVLRFQGPVAIIGVENPKSPITIDGVVCDPKDDYAFIVPVHFLGTHGLVDEPQPLVFNARRWVTGQSHFRPVNPTIMPFGFGPRICPGRDLAEVEALICVATLLNKFTMALTPDDHKNTFRVTMQPDRDIRIAFTKVPASE